MKRIEVHEYRTPTRDNPDCEWSLGIMNLTKAEAREIAAFAYKVREANSVTSGTFAVRVADYEQWPVVRPEPNIIEPEQKNGNRFSGLDLETK